MKQFFTALLWGMILTSIAGLVSGVFDGDLKPTIDDYFSLGKLYLSACTLAILYHLKGNEK